ncbi:MAG: hypothetical protein ACLQIH_01585 [Myxococcaceae bacterium]
MAPLLLAAPVGAGEEPSWSVESGKTVGSGNNVFWGQVGFPGVWAEFIHGTDATTEIGGKFAFNYAVEGLVNSCCLGGMDLQFLARTTLFDNGRTRIAASFDPGLLLYFPPGFALFGITFPVGVEFGFPVSSVVSLNASFDLPMYVLFSGGGYSTVFAVPILFGGGIEYLAKKNFALTFKLKLGPTILASGGYIGGNAQFSLYALLGAAYKF